MASMNHTAQPAAPSVSLKILEFLVSLLWISWSWFLALLFLKDSKPTNMFAGFTMAHRELMLSCYKTKIGKAIKQRWKQQESLAYSHSSENILHLCGFQKQRNLVLDIWLSQDASHSRPLLRFFTEHSLYYFYQLWAVILWHGWQL